MKALTLAAVEKMKTAMQDLLVDLTFKARVQDAYVPGAPVTHTETSTTVKGVISKYRHDEVDGTLIQYSDILLLVFPNSASAIPKQNDVVVLPDLRECRVINSDPTYVGSDIAFSMVQARPN